MHLDLTFQVYTFVMRCFGMCIFDPRRLLKRSRAVFKNKWLMEGLSVRNTILLEFCSDVNSVPPAPPPPVLWHPITWFPSLADFLFISLLFLSFFTSFVSQERLHYVLVPKMSVASQCTHLPLALATCPTLASKRLCSWGPWAKWSLLAAWGNTIRAYFSYYNRKRNLEDFVEFFSDWKWHTDPLRGLSVEDPWVGNRTQEGSRTE